MIFVGDTHGDLEASQKVIKDYLLAHRSEGGKLGNKIIFLGDYVDRGFFSKENLDFLLRIRAENLDQIYLLQGNHESHRILKFSPADFWEGLSEKIIKNIQKLLKIFLWRLWPKIFWRSMAPCQI